MTYYYAVRSNCQVRLLRYHAEVRYRTFGRVGWQVSEVGYGMWGMAGWSGSDDEQSLAALDRAVELGCNFFDTAWAYGDGRSEQLLGRTLAKHRGRELYVATKIPPKNRRWPALDSYPIGEVFPPDYIRQYTELSLRNVGVDALDLQQFHVWTDAWATDAAWQRAVRALKDEGIVRAIGISINRWEPGNVLRTLETGLIDTVQVVYNVFDQSPEDRLLPYCTEHDIAVIARVPFDEGSLTGTLTAESRWPEGDFRNLYFTEETLPETLARVEHLRCDVPAEMTMAELALRYILANPAVSSVIPGMRKIAHVQENIAVSDRDRLNSGTMERLRSHRWDRLPGACP